MAIVKFMKASSAEAMTRQLNGIVIGKTNLVRGRDDRGTPTVPPNNLYKHPVAGLTLIFTTPGFTVTFSDDLHCKAIVAEINAAAGSTIAYLYKTDANAEKGVKVIGVFPEDSHPPIIYPVAETASSKDAETPAFLKCLQSGKAKDIFQTQGFIVLAN